MEWYDKAQDKIVFLKGAKGVGKTWTMIDFGQGFFKHLIYIDLEKDADSHHLFKRGAKTDAAKLIASLAIYVDGIAQEESNTLFVFDEPQSKSPYDSIKNHDTLCEDIVLDMVRQDIKEAEQKEGEEE